MKNRTIMGILCIILAVTVMFGISPIINKMASGKVQVLQLKCRVEQGQVITEEDIKNAEIGAFGLKSGFLTDSDQVVGKFASETLFPDVNLYPAMLSDTADSAEDVFRTLDGKHQAISVSLLSLANGLSGKLKNGDIVSVITASNGESAIPPELTYLKVITSTSAKGNDSDEAAADTKTATELPVTITLLVNPTQAKLLALLEQTSKMHFALVYRGDGTVADKFLQAQEKLFESGVASDE